MISLNSARLRGLLVAVCLAGTITAAKADGFQPMVDDAYGAYRAALFKTNANDQKGTEAALAVAAAAWDKVIATYRAAPPAVYASDQRFGESLDTVAALLKRATAETTSGGLTAAHETLEGIRDTLGELRKRNNVIVFSDHINAYHTEMERILGGEIALDNPRDLNEQVGVLVYLDKQIRDNAPSTYRSDAKFQQLSAGNQTAVENLRKALAKGTAKDIKTAIDGLKPAYSKLFLAFG